MKIKKYIFLMLGLIVALGCTSLIRPDAEVPFALNTADIEANNFAPFQDKSVVYIFRDRSSARYNKIATFVDDKHIADTVHMSYIRIVLEPGLHHVISKAERECKLDIETLPGQIYFVAQKDKFGVMEPRCWMQVVPIEEGRNSIQRCRLLVVQGGSEL